MDDPVRIGYARVSSEEQNLNLQLDALEKAGVSRDRIYEDKLSGKTKKRPGLEGALKAVQPGNLLVVWKLDRLGRSLQDLVSIVEELREKEVGLKVLEGKGADIDTSTPHGRLVFGLFASLAEYERELISERTRAGLAAARARGRVGGRKKKMDEKKLRLAAAAMKDRGVVVSELAKELGVSRSSLYKYISPKGEIR
jgi:DNA invertase Pin-like site-specific DNA recombinase